VARVLVIDDCQDFRDWARCVLEREGLDVIEARDALAGLQRSVEDAPDLVLLAQDLSGLDGLDVASRLSQESATCGLPVLVSSECVDGALRRAARSVGAQGVLPRSYRAADLAGPVRDTLVAAGVTWIPAVQSAPHVGGPTAC